MASVYAQSSAVVRLSSDCHLSICNSEVIFREIKLYEGHHAYS